MSDQAAVSAEAKSQSNTMTIHEFKKRLKRVRNENNIFKYILNKRERKNKDPEYHKAKFEQMKKQINIIDPSGITPLIYLIKLYGRDVKRDIKERYSPMIIGLLKAGANVNLTSQSILEGGAYHRPLFDACKTLDENLINLIKEYGGLMQDSETQNPSFRSFLLNWNEFLFRSSRINEILGNKTRYLKILKKMLNCGAYDQNDIQILLEHDFNDGEHDFNDGVLRNIKLVTVKEIIKYVLLYSKQRKTRQINMQIFRKHRNIFTSMKLWVKIVDIGDEKGCYQLKTLIKKRVVGKVIVLSDREVKNRFARTFMRDIYRSDLRKYQTSVNVMTINENNDFEEVPFFYTLTALRKINAAERKRNAAERKRQRNAAERKGNGMRRKGKRQREEAWKPYKRQRGSGNNESKSNPLHVQIQSLRF